MLPQLKHLHQLYKVLAKARQRRGAIDFETQRGRVPPRAVGRGRAARRVRAQRRAQAHRGMHDRRECRGGEVPAQAPHSGAVSRARAAAGVEVRGSAASSSRNSICRCRRVEQVTPADFSALLKKVRKRPDASLIESVLLRSQSLAVYQPGDPGHFGLALDDLYAFHLADPALSGSARASRDPPRARRRQAGRLHVQRERHGRHVRALLAERAARRRSRARCRRALQVRVDGEARRQRIRRHRLGRHLVRPVRRAGRIEDQRARAHHAAAERLLPFRCRAASAHRRATRAEVPARRSRARAGAAREPRRSQDRFPAGDRSAGADAERKRR